MSIRERLLQQAARFLRGESGPTAVEYAVMLAMIIVVCVVAITALGANASDTFSQVGGAAKPLGS